jgi:hypothetical protein
VSRAVYVTVASPPVDRSPAIFGDTTTDRFPQRHGSPAEFASSPLRRDGQTSGDDYTTRKQRRDGGGDNDDDNLIPSGLTSRQRQSLRRLFFAMDAVWVPFGLGGSGTSLPTRRKPRWARREKPPAVGDHPDPDVRHRWTKVYVTQKPCCVLLLTAPNPFQQYVL